MGHSLEAVQRKSPRFNCLHCLRPFAINTLIIAVMLWSNTATMADAGDVGGRNVLGSVSKAKAIPKSGDAASPPNPR